ncbi:MAG: tail fiber domain-containing protein [Waterburya sp.]
MVSTPFGLEGPKGHTWKLDIDSGGSLLFKAEDPQPRMSIEDTIGGVTITTFSDVNWAIQINNQQQTVHQAGMRVTNDGFFEITNRINGFTGTARLHSGGVWFTQSDLNSKTDVQTASNLLEKALSLNPINFYYKKQDLNELPHKLMGFIAQEVEEILPHAVAGTDSKYLDYNAIVPVAIGAIKEMKQCYDDKIANLEMQLEQLKKILLNSQMAA